MALSILNSQDGEITGATEARLNHLIGKSRNRVLDGLLIKHLSGSQVSLDTGVAIINGYFVSRQGGTSSISFSNQSNGVKYISLMADPTQANNAGGTLGTTGYSVSHAGVALVMDDNLPNQTVKLIIATCTIQAGDIVAGSLRMVPEAYERYSQGNSDFAVAHRSREYKEVSLSFVQGGNSALPLGNGVLRTGTDFKTKALGSVANPNIARRGNITTEALPAPYTLAEFTTQAAYDAIKTVGGAESLQSTAVVGARPVQEFNFDIVSHLVSMYPLNFSGMTTVAQKRTEALRILTSLRPIVYGRGVGGNTAGVQVFAYSIAGAGAWSKQLENFTIDAPSTAMTVLYSTPAQVANLIDLTGYTSWSVITNPMLAGGTQCLNYVDFISIQVQVDTSKLVENEYINSRYLAPRTNGVTVQEDGIYRISTTGILNFGQTQALGTSTVQLKVYTNKVLGAAVTNPNRQGVSDIEINLVHNGLESYFTAFSGSADIWCAKGDSISVEILQQPLPYAADAKFEDLQLSIEYMGYSGLSMW